MPDATGNHRQTGEEISLTVTCHLTFDQHEVHRFLSYFSKCRSSSSNGTDSSGVAQLYIPIQKCYVLETATTVGRTHL